MTADAWDPGQYERFRAERSRPFHDLAALVDARPGMRALDLGCGTGALTRQLHDQLGARTTLGVDTSEAMLARCAEHAGGGLSFVQGDLAEPAGWGSGGDFDLVFSNAALHWVEDHPSLLGGLVRLLAPAGQLAIQVPANHGHVSQTVAVDVARREPFAEALSGYVRESPVLEAVDYAQRLHALGLADVHASLRVYLHELPDRGAVLEWMRGTTLTDYQRRMPAGLFDEYLAVYAAELRAQLPDQRPFLFPFQRILFAGSLSARDRGLPGWHSGA